MKIIFEKGELDIPLAAVGIILFAQIMFGVAVYYRLTIISVGFVIVSGFASYCSDWKVN